MLMNVKKVQNINSVCMWQISYVCYMCVCASVCACVCVCVRERDNVGKLTLYEIDFLLEFYSKNCL